MTGWGPLGQDVLFLFTSLIFLARRGGRRGQFAGGPGICIATVVIPVQSVIQAEPHSGLPVEAAAPDSA